MILGAVVRKTKFYNKILSNLNFIRSEKINKIIGVNVLKWIVVHTVFKYFNQRLKLKTRIENSSLYNLRHEMTISEIDHLIGFVFVTVFAFAKIITLNYLFAFVILLVNVVMNFYPSLLQQENKRRIDKLINRM
ncbi:glycosyl-4,4'-diaponeurosporenoate acyltransferase CrtO family protein [Hymenobacter agri]